MTQSIGVYELKTRISKILREVAGGASFTITHRGKTVAKLGPHPEEDPPLGADEDWSGFWEVVEELRKSPPVDDRPLQELLDEIRG